MYSFHVLLRLSWQPVEKKMDSHSPIKVIWVLFLEPGRSWQPLCFVSKKTKHKHTIILNFLKELARFVGQNKKSSPSHIYTSGINTSVSPWLWWNHILHLASLRLAMTLFSLEYWYMNRVCSLWNIKAKSNYWNEWFTPTSSPFFMGCSGSPSPVLIWEPVINLLRLRWLILLLTWRGPAGSVLVDECEHHSGSVHMIWKTAAYTSFRPSLWQFYPKFVFVKNSEEKKDIILSNTLSPLYSGACVSVICVRNFMALYIYKFDLLSLVPYGSLTS